MRAPSLAEGAHTQRTGHRHLLPLRVAMGSRLLKEYRETKTAAADPDIVLSVADESDIFRWSAQLKGPPGTPYEGGTFRLTLVCPQSYPLAPPKVTFDTPVFHPCAHRSPPSALQRD